MIRLAMGNICYPPRSSQTNELTISKIKLISQISIDHFVENFDQTITLKKSRTLPQWGRNSKILQPHYQFFNKKNRIE